MNPSERRARQKTHDSAAATQACAAMSLGANVERLVGKWEGPETPQPSHDGFGGTSRGSLTVRMLGETFLLVDYQRERDWSVCYRAHATLARDARDERFVLTWCDDRGQGLGERAVGTWVEEELRFERELEQDSVRLVCALRGSSAVTVRVERLVGDDQWVCTLEGEYHRLRR